jgi:hypothetical protein
MTATAVRVSPEWLALREPADAAARSAELATRLAWHRRAGPLVSRERASGPLVIHDLGGGSGAMGRWLGPRLHAPQHWIVHDRDDDLLALAAAPGVEPRLSDVTQLTRDDLAGASLVTASALLDLLTTDELERMLAACSGQPALLALTVTGRVALTPPDPLDARIQAAFNAHQRRGGRLGPHAARAAACALRATGAEVLVRGSPWRLGPAHAGLIAEWLNGWVAAAREQEPDLHADEYRERRLGQAAAGELAVTVDHADVLALP